MREVENPMVLDRLWRHREQEPVIVGECAGCGEDITAKDDYYNFSLGDKKNVLIHQKDDCCRQFIGANSWSRSAGEE